MSEVISGNNSFDPAGANETDVREEYLAPILAGLGYRRGTKWDLLTEFPLSYDRITLGRRKKASPVVRGKADYLLKAGTKARWVLEAKAPITLSNEDIDQVLSYARHPEVSAQYAGICNGLEFRLYRSSQFSDQEPLLRFRVSTIQNALDALSGILHPECLERSFKAPEVSALRPVASGRTGDEKIVGGFSRALSVNWHCALDLEPKEKVELDHVCQKLVGTESAITGGRVARDSDGRLFVSIDWHFPHRLMQQFASRKGLERYTLHCLGDELSTNPDHPSYFEATQVIDVDVGDTGFDITKWEETVFDAKLEATMVSQTMGYLQESEVFVGFTTALISFVDPSDGEPLLWMQGFSSVEFYLCN